MSPLARGALTFLVVLLSALAFAFRSDDPRRLAFVVYAAPWWLIPTLVVASGAGVLMLLSPTERRPLMRVGGAVALAGAALLGALGLASARTGGVASALIVLLAILLGGAVVIAVMLAAIGTALGDRILRKVLLGGIAVALLVLGFDLVSYRKLAQACASGGPACGDPVRRARDGGQEEAFRIYADACTGGGHDAAVGCDLAAEIAEERGRLDLAVGLLDRACALDGAGSPSCDQSRSLRARLERGAQGR